MKVCFFPPAFHVRSITDICAPRHVPSSSEVRPPVPSRLPGHGWGQFETDGGQLAPSGTRRCHCDDLDAEQQLLLAGILKSGSRSFQGSAALVGVGELGFFELSCFLVDLYTHSRAGEWLMRPVAKRQKKAFTLIAYGLGAGHYLLCINLP